MFWNHFMFTGIATNQNIKVNNIFKILYYLSGFTQYDESTEFDVFVLSRNLYGINSHLNVIQFWMSLNLLLSRSTQEKSLVMFALCRAISNWCQIIFASAFNTAIHFCIALHYICWIIRLRYSTWICCVERSNLSIVLIPWFKLWLHSKHISFSISFEPEIGNIFFFLPLVVHSQNWWIQEHNFLQHSLQIEQNVGMQCNQQTSSLVSCDLHFHPNYF